MSVAAALMLLSLSATGDAPTAPPLLDPVGERAADRTWKKQRMLTLLLEKDALVGDRPSQAGPVMMLVGHAATGAGAVVLLSQSSWLGGGTTVIAGAVLAIAMHIGLGIFAPMLAVRQAHRISEHDARLSAVEGELRGLLLPPPTLLPVETLR